MEEESKLEPSVCKSKENIKAYQEMCGMIKHYSSLSSNVRIILIVQCIVLVGFTINNFEKISCYILSLPIFGILLTIFLGCFYKAYNRPIEHFYELISYMEENLFDVGFRPFQSFKGERDKWYKSCIRKFLALYSPFLFACIVFVIVFIIGFLKLKNCQ